MSFAAEKRLWHVPAAPIEAVDSTGAGDAFTAALAVAMLERPTGSAAVLFATAAAHLAVTGYGSQEAYPARGEIEAFIPRLAAHLYELDPVYELEA